MKKLRKQSAFTLIELLVVISIIALLLAILMPSLGKAKKIAQKVVCQSNQRQIFLSFTMYCNANNDHYPYSGFGEQLRVQIPYIDRWFLSLVGYSEKNQEEFFKNLFCPASRHGEDMWTVKQGIEVGYSYNMRLENFPGTWPTINDWPYMTCKSTQLKYPDSTPLIGESKHFCMTSSLISSATNQPYYGMTDRHVTKGEKGNNWLRCDGSIIFFPAPEHFTMYRDTDPRILRTSADGGKW
jgi:prepilin-type N-terminal cleavage/methylation domain-containing protein